MVDQPGLAVRLVYVPCWFLCVFSVFLPALWLRRHLRQRRHAKVRGFAVEQVAEPEVT